MVQMPALRRFALALALALLVAALPGPVPAQGGHDPFEHGWTLDPDASRLRFASVKNDRVAEDNGFTALSGQITPDGEIRLAVDLETVETGIDIRNVRLRFIFFETYLYREAVITARLAEADLATLGLDRHLALTLPVTLSLHGAEQAFDVPLDITLLDHDRVAVHAMTPVAVPMAPFGLDGGRAQLESTANVKILPLVFVTFELVFQRNAPGTRPPEPGQTILAARGAEMSRRLQDVSNVDLSVASVGVREEVERLRYVNDALDDRR